MLNIVKKIAVSLFNHVFVLFLVEDDSIIFLLARTEVEATLEASYSFLTIESLTK